MIKVKRLDPNAILPVKAKEGDSGYDICSSVYMRVPVNSTVKVPTGLSFEAPQGYELQVRPRSGLSSKGLIVTLGTVDNGYRGEVQVIFTNNSNQSYQIQHGDKIAQIVPVAIPHFEIIEVDELSETNRGCNGFGSTGLNIKTEQIQRVVNFTDPFNHEIVEYIYLHLQSGLREYRKNLGLTIDQLADLLEVTPVDIKHYENLRVPMTVKQAQKLIKWDQQQREKEKKNSLLYYANAHIEPSMTIEDFNTKTEQEPYRELSNQEVIDKLMKQYNNERFNQWEEVIIPVSPSDYKQMQELGMIPKEKDNVDNIDLKTIGGEGKGLFEGLFLTDGVNNYPVDNSGIDNRVPKVGK